MQCQKNEEAAGGKRATEAVSGIQLTDAYPDTELAFSRKHPGLPEPVNWDFIASATVEQ